MKRSENEWTEEPGLFPRQSSTKGLVRGRGKAIGDGQSGRRAQTAEKSVGDSQNGQEKMKDGLEIGERQSVYIPRKRGDGREAALHPNRSRQT